MAKLLKISEVRDLLEKDCFTKRSMPSHHTVVSWIEEGFLKGKRVGKQGIWYVDADGLSDFIKKLQANQLEHWIEPD